MKKAVIFLVSLNIVLVVTSTILFNKYSKFSDDLTTIQQKDLNQKQLKTNVYVDKTDPIYIYNSHKFSCSSSYTSFEINLCSGEKLQFADSLLNQLVKRKLNILDDYIKMDKEEVLKAKENTFFVNCLRTNIAQKEAFLESQKYWKQMRKSNSKIVELGCDGGTSCTGIVNSAEIKDVLNRIKLIKDMNLGCN